MLYYYLDVSELFFPEAYTCDNIQLLNTSASSIKLPNWTCNEINYTIINLSRFTLVESIEIGNDCFIPVKTFRIDGLNRLKTIKIGINSFTHQKNSYGNDINKSFHILNCESLEYIEIGEYSFSDYSGEFELKNLPQLLSIQIGIVGSDSYNFWYSSFVIRGIDVILKI